MSPAEVMTRAAGPTERGMRSQAGAGSGSAPGSPRWLIAAGKRSASSGSVIERSMPSGVNSRSLSAWSQVRPVRTSMRRPSTM